LSKNGNVSDIFYFTTDNGRGLVELYVIDYAVVYECWWLAGAKIICYLIVLAARAYATYGFFSLCACGLQTLDLTCLDDLDLMFASIATRIVLG
jgi:hypothetical protein